MANITKEEIQRRAYQSIGNEDRQRNDRFQHYINYFDHNGSPLRSWGAQKYQARRYNNANIHRRAARMTDIIRKLIQSWYTDMEKSGILECTEPLDVRYLMPLTEEICGYLRQELNIPTRYYEPIAYNGFPSNFLEYLEIFKDKT